MVIEANLVVSICVSSGLGEVTSSVSLARENIGVGTQSIRSISISTLSCFSPQYISLRDGSQLTTMVCQSPTPFLRRPKIQVIIARIRYLRSTFLRRKKRRTPACSLCPSVGSLRNYARHRLRCDRPGLGTVLCFLGQAPRSRQGSPAPTQRRPSPACPGLAWLQKSTPTRHFSVFQPSSPHRPPKT